ncbi:MAG: acyl-CoA synthetase [Saprospiraceae bacterium]
MIELINRANSFANRTAVISNQTAFTFQQLLNTSSAIAYHLLDGVKDLAETRVVFLVPPSFEYVATQWAIWRAGGIAVPLCTLHPLPSLQYVIEDTDAAILVVSQEYKALLTPLAEERGMRLLLITDLMDGATVDLPAIALDRRAMILYTSGTTNLPKGVVTTHQNIQFQIETLVNAWEWEQTDHILNILPLHHVHGIINVLSCALWSGACCEFLPKFDAPKVWQKLSGGQLTLFMAVPTIYFKLIAFWDAASIEEKERLSQGVKALRLMVSGSAALPVPVLEKWREISTHTLLERYGMTEIGMALSNAYRTERRPGHVGLPLPGVQIRLVDADGKDVKGTGEPGEIQIKGPNVFKEYWRKPKATKDAYMDGWFRSGDVAIFNEGMFKILGRDSVDIIKSGGYKISALEIEDVLRRHPGIKECAVVGLPDKEWGEVVAASLISENKQLDFDAIKQWLKELLPAYKIPRKFIIQDELPRNTLGKVTKKVLRAEFE